MSEAHGSKSVLNAELDRELVWGVPEQVTDKKLSKPWLAFQTRPEARGCLGVSCRSFVIPFRGRHSTSRSFVAQEPTNLGFRIAISFAVFTTGRFSCCVQGS